jgi:hypothetical protein
MLCEHKGNDGHEGIGRRSPWLYCGYCGQGVLNAFRLS